jgi:hypothetical protein
MASDTLGIGVCFARHFSIASIMLCSNPTTFLTGKSSRLGIQAPVIHICGIDKDIYHIYHIYHICRLEGSWNFPQVLTQTILGYKMAQATEQNITQLSAALDRVDGALEAVGLPRRVFLAGLAGLVPAVATASAAAANASR